MLDKNWYTLFGNLLEISAKSYMGKKGAEIMAEEVKKELDGESTLEELSKEADLIGIRMGFLAHGPDFFLDNGFPVEVWERAEKNRVKALAKAAARALNLEDETPLLDKETRTEEQQRAMIEISGRDQLNRLKTYMRSNYFASIGIFLDAFAAALHVEKEAVYKLEEWDDISGACAYLNPYFYALHKDINPEAEAALTDENREEIKALVNKLFAYKEEHGGTFESCIAGCFKDAKQLEKLTEISRADFFGLPLSKAWRNQRAIAAEGAAGREINVGNKTLGGAVIVNASISDLEGKPLNITEIHKGVQRAIADLIYEAGGKKALPINVSPAQIYRAYARLPFNAMVTAQQEAEMEAAMDMLMYAPSRVDFKAQLQKHKHIEKQADYDYDGEAAGKLEGNLVQAQKLEGTAKNGARVVAYKIYDVPVYYMYSHVVGQMAWLPNALLTGLAKPSSKPEKAEAQQGAQYVAVKENILTRILRMKERKRAKETYIKLIRAEEVAEDCGVTLTDKTRRTLLKNMGLCLDDLKEQKQIKGYEETKQGRKIAGYSIIL